MIKMKNVYKKYNGNNVIKNMSYKFNKGLYIMTGSSGRGKTTLINIISGVDRKYQGNVEVSEPVLYFKDKGCLPSNLTVKEVFYLFEQINKIHIKEYLDIKELLNKKIKKLSLGEYQLIVLTLVLNSDSKIIMLDEPFSALSLSNLNKVSALLEKKAKDKLIIVVTHNTSHFKKFTLLDLDKYKPKSIKEDISNGKKQSSKKFTVGCYLLYLKKTLIRKFIFLITILITIFNYFYINDYTKSITNDLLIDMEKSNGVIIEKKSQVNELNENIFYDVIKKIARYAYDYNANYYNSKLYDQSIKVDDYYIDNAFVFSSIKYIEESLLENEIILGIDYNNFCKINNIVNCDENYLRVLLVNKKINAYNYVVKNIFDNKETVVLSNKRFNKIYENNEYDEYYFDVKKEHEEYVFEIIEEDEFLLNFDFVKVGENEDSIRYVVKVDDSSNFQYQNINYSKYIVCTAKGYDCLNYLNHFSSLVSINDFKEIGELDLEITQQKLTLDEIILSSKLAEKLNLKANDIADFYFNYKDKIVKIPLLVKNVINCNKDLIYHNSNWGYEFFKEKVQLESKDLIIKNIAIYEDLKEGDKISENAYGEALKEVKDILEDTNTIINVVNISVNLTSILIVVLIELFYNKFKKEYFSFLKIVGN